MNTEMEREVQGSEVSPWVRRTRQTVLVNAGVLTELAVWEHNIVGNTCLIYLYLSTTLKFQL